MMYFLDLLGTLAFAISGAYKAKGRELNVFGVVFLGLITAMGGGTIRDLIIGRTPLFYLKDQNYLLITVVGALVAYVVPAFFKKRYTFFRFLDSLGLATFVIIGVSIAYNFFNQQSSILIFVASIFLGILTGCGGGILRDAIMGDTPFALKHGSNYITSAFWGSLVFYLLMFVNLKLAMLVSIILTLILREFVAEFGFYNKVIKNKATKAKK